MSLIENAIDALTLPGRGILAADESTPTITKRLKEINAKAPPKADTITDIAIILQI